MEKSYMLDEITTSTLLTMVKALPRYGTYDYTTVIGIKKGLACVTDGFWLLEFKPNVHIGPDRTLTKNLTESPVIFPRWDNLTAGESVVSMTDNEGIDALIKELKPANNKINFCLVVGEQGLSIERYTKNKIYKGPFFNIKLLTQAAKGLPKGAKCKNIQFSDDRLICTFSSPVGEFKITVASLRHM